MERFEDVIEKMMEERGMPSISDGVSVKIANANAVLYNAAKWYFGRVGREYVVQKDVYGEISDWLSDNKRKGLFLQGNHGLGKTVLAKYILPAVLLYYGGMVARYFTSVTMASHMKEIRAARIIVIDDIGIESQAVEYGNRHNLMDEVMDDVEQNGKLIILTSNLDKRSLEERYGKGVMDRIIASTRQVVFRGDSFRRK